MTHQSTNEDQAAMAISPDPPGVEQRPFTEAEAAAFDSVVVPLDEYRVKAGGDDAGFLGCPKCQGDEFAVVCRGLPGKPFVAALLCVACDPVVEIPVANGWIGG